MVKDREAWRAAVHGVAKSRIWLTEQQQHTALCQKWTAVPCVSGFLTQDPMVPEVLCPHTSHQPQHVLHTHTHIHTRIKSKESQWPWPQKERENGLGVCIPFSNYLCPSGERTAIDMLGPCPPGSGWQAEWILHVVRLSLQRSCRVGFHSLCVHAKSLQSRPTLCLHGL